MRKSPGTHQVDSYLLNYSLKKADIIDDVVNDFEPKCFLAPYYGKKHRSVTLGNAIKPSKTQIRPSLKIYCPDIQSTHGLTIVLTDPDAPSRSNPEWAEFCHWIGIIPVPDQEFLEMSMASGAEKELVECTSSLSLVTDIGNNVAADKPPGPPPKTGYHRYVFLLLQGDNTNLTAPKDRKNWGTGKERHGVRDWAKKEGLEVIGANFFISKNKKQ
jgi:phosphatidylethanolamine-binding protein